MVSEICKLKETSKKMMESWISSILIVVEDKEPSWETEKWKKEWPRQAPNDEYVDSW